MGEEGDERDEELAAGVEADGVGGALAEHPGAVVERLDELEHGVGWGRVRRGGDDGWVGGGTIGAGDELGEGEDGGEGDGELGG